MKSDKIPDTREAQDTPAPGDAGGGTGDNPRLDDGPGGDAAAEMQAGLDLLAGGGDSGGNIGGGGDGDGWDVSGQKQGEEHRAWTRQQEAELQERNREIEANEARLRSMTRSGRVP